LEVKAEGDSSLRTRRRHDQGVTEELPDDTILMMEVLFDIRSNTDLIIDLLMEDDREEEAGDA
jgi:hypothetical protein